MKYLAYALSTVFLSFSAYAQNASDANTRKELKLNLNESGSNYVKMTFLNQTWLRLNENNPGSTVASDPENTTLDIGLRRTRIQLFGQLNKHVFFYTQFGMNNFNKLSAFPAYNTAGTASNRKVAAFFHDAVGEYHAYKKGTNFVRFGGGLTIVNGFSRFSAPGVSSILTMDVPVFAQATVDQMDQFGRKLEIYSRGQLGKINYRIGLADPFPVETNGAAPPALQSNSVFAHRKHRKQINALLIYNLFDTEDNTTPGYMPGTSLGSKKIWNIEAGLTSQANATWRKQGEDTLYNHMKLWSVATYLDMPLNASKGTAISAFAGYFKTDYGRGYLRYNGIMNVASGTTQPITGVGATQGNAFPMFGNGALWYAQVGYKFKNNLLGERGTLLPYASLQSASYDRLNDRMNVWNAGINWLIQGQNSKLTLNYENRPVYKNSPANPNLLDRVSSKGSWVLQFQVFI